MSAKDPWNQVARFRPEHRDLLAHRSTTCVRPDYEGRQARFRHVARLADSSPSGTPGPAAPSPAFSRSTSRSRLGASTRSFACQVNRSAPSRQQQRSHGDSLKTSCRSRSVDSDATVQADSALTTTTAVSPERIVRYRRVLKPHTSTRRTSSSVASATRRRCCELQSRRRLQTVADEKLGNRRVQII